MKYDNTYMRAFPYSQYSEDPVFDNLGKYAAAYSRPATTINNNELTGEQYSAMQNALLKASGRLRGIRLCPR